MGSLGLVLGLALVFGLVVLLVVLVVVLVIFGVNDDLLLAVADDGLLGMTLLLAGFALDGRLLSLLRAVPVGVVVGVDVDLPGEMGGSILLPSVEVFISVLLVVFNPHASFLYHY